MSLRYEHASEALLISVEWLFLNSDHFYSNGSYLMWKLVEFKTVKSNENYQTNGLILTVKIFLCSKFPYPNVLDNETPDPRPQHESQ